MGLEISELLGVPRTARGWEGPTGGGLGLPRPRRGSRLASGRQKLGTDPRKDDSRSTEVSPGRKSQNRAKDASHPHAGDFNYLGSISLLFKILLVFLFCSTNFLF